MLSSLGIRFEVRTAAVDETYPSDFDPFEVPMFLARKKVEAVSDSNSKSLVIGADTVVILNHQILGKPKNHDQAAEFLSRLSGRDHQVVTGVCIKYHDTLSLFKEITQVTFGELSRSDIDHYITSCQPFDKAGAYGIQEWIGMIGVSKIEGSYYNVVGLPVHRLYQELRKFT
ncbi:MAG: Maf-like protein [Cyclobacteriaceae bacterium]|nr:MAG: Maf-like protein [Cyclobacteriaceae bacterium]